MNSAQGTAGEIAPPKRAVAFQLAWDNLLDGVRRVLETGDRNPYEIYDWEDPGWSTREMRTLHQTFADAMDDLFWEYGDWIGQYDCDWVGFDWSS